MKKYFVATFIFIVLINLSNAQTDNWEQSVSSNPNLPEKAVYQDTSLSAKERVQDLMLYLTFDEIVKLTGGDRRFFMPGITRLGLRPIFMSDASQGLRPSRYNTIKKSTSFPGTVALASTWNPELAYQMGKAVAKECRGNGVDILLGPGMNMHRFSVSGRNYEYFGEDPLLTGKLAAAYIRGMQSLNILATGKHFVANDQEFCRHITSCNVDERTLREIYMKPWEIAIKEADLKAIMTGNNQVNGTPLALDMSLTQHVLRDDFGFEGIIMTDWQNSRYYPNLQYLFPGSGVSLHMPDNESFKAYLEHFLKIHPDKKDEIKDAMAKKVYHNLFPLFELNVYDRAGKDAGFASQMAANKLVAKKIAQEGICLLKNDDQILPIKKNKKVLLAGKQELQGGTGSGAVKGYDHISFEDGLKEAFGDKLSVSIQPSDEEVRTADYVIYRLNKAGGEGYDVPFELGLTDEISKIAALNPNIIVVVSSCNGLPMPWLKDVKGLLWSYFLGQERGTPFADIISGKISPSGKLPFTLEKSFNDSPNPHFNYLGDAPYWRGNNNNYKDYWLFKKETGTKTDPNFKKYVKPGQTIPMLYSEGLLMGYRWYDAKNINVHFPFGYGLSYTQFSLSEAKVSSHHFSAGDSIQLSVKLKNTGKMPGAEVIQLYVSNRTTGEHPVKELKAFKKVNLKPGKSNQVSFTIKPKDLQFWNTEQASWVTNQGQYQLLIGTSCKDLMAPISIQFREPTAALW